MVAAAGAVRIYQLPHPTHSLEENATMVSISLLALFVIVVPIQCWIQKASFPQAILVWVVGMVMAAMLTVLAHSMAAAARSGGGDVEKIQNHKNALDTVLGQ